MSVFDFLFLLVIAAGAFYAGYQTGRASTLSAGRETDAAPPSDNPLPGPGSFPSRRRSDQYDDANAGGTAPSGSGGAPRRTATKPPPAAAGLLDKGDKDS